MAKPSKKEKPKKEKIVEKPKEKVLTLPVKMTLSELMRRKEEIGTLLASLEDEYREATVSEKSYNEIKQKNQEKLSEVQNRIRQMKQETEERAFAPPPVKKVEEKEEVSEEEPEEVEETEAETELKGGGIDRLESDLNKTVIELEKLKTLVDSIKEMRSTTEDKIQRLMESVGEIRSLVFQREGEIGEQTTRMEKLSELIGEMKPEKIATELSKRDKELTTHEARLEKLEIKSDDMLKTMKNIQKMLEGMGSLENVVNVSKNVAEKGIKVEKSVKDIERLTDKVEKLYVELNKNLEDFMTYKAKQEEMEELLKELVRTVDQINIKLEGYARSEELTALKMMVEEMDKKIQMSKAELSVKELPPELQELQRQKEEIGMLLSSVEDEYKSRKISEDEFKKIKESNQKKLAEIEKKIKEESKKLEEKEEVVEAEEAKPETKIEPIDVEATKKKVEKVVKGKEIPPVEEPITKKSLLGKKERLAFEIKDLFEKGLISQEAFEKTKRLLSK